MAESLDWRNSFAFLIRNSASSTVCNMKRSGWIYPDLGWPKRRHLTICGENPNSAWHNLSTEALSDIQVVGTPVNTTFLARLSFSSKSIYTAKITARLNGALRIVGVWFVGCWDLSVLTAVTDTDGTESGTAVESIQLMLLELLFYQHCQ